MRRYKSRKKRRYGVKSRKRTYRRKNGMKAQTKNMLKGGAVASAILVFSEKTYAWLYKTLRGGV